MITTDTTDIAALDTDALQRLAAQGSATASAAQAELQRRAEARQRAIVERQRAWDADLVRRYPAMDAELVQQAKDCEKAFTRAVYACDLDAALEAWIRSRSTRDARQQIRDAARSSQANAGPQPGVVISDVILAYYPADFMQRVEETASAAASALAGATAEAMIGERPDDLDGGE